MMPIMDRTQILFFRNLFLRAVVVSIALALLLFGATFALWDTGAALMLSLFKVSEADFGRLVVHFFANVRLVVVFLFLAPALALHWTARKV